MVIYNVAPPPPSPTQHPGPPLVLNTFYHHQLNTEIKNADLYAIINIILIKYIQFPLHFNCGGKLKIITAFELTMMLHSSK